MERADDMLADTVARKTEVVMEQKDKIKLKLDVWKTKLQKLASIQEKRKLEVADEFTMNKAEINQATIEINNLQTEIGKALNQQTIGGGELKKLEVRIKSLEAILPSDDNQKN